MPQSNFLYNYSLTVNRGAPDYYKQLISSTHDVSAFEDIRTESTHKQSGCTIIVNKGFSISYIYSE